MVVSAVTARDLRLTLPDEVTPGRSGAAASARRSRGRGLLSPQAGPGRGLRPGRAGPAV